jgi:hypothetical protein
LKTADFADVSSDQKYYASEQDEDGKYFKTRNEYVVKATEESKDSVGAKNAIDNDFQHFDIDNYKTDVDKNVHDTRQWAAYHFGLAERYPGHHGETLTFAIGAVHIAAQENVSPYFFDLKGKEARSGNEDYNENNV